MGNLSITSNRVQILSGGKLQIKPTTSFSTDWVFPENVVKYGYVMPDADLIDGDNLVSAEGGEAIIGASGTTEHQARGVSLSGFNFTGSNAIPTNANITKVEFAYKSRYILNANATDPNIVGDPAEDLTYCLAIGFFASSPSINYDAAFSTFGWDYPDGKSFTVHAPVSNNTSYPSDPIIEDFYHLASTSYPAFEDQVQPSHINGSNSFSIRLGRRGGKSSYDASVQSGIAGMIDSSTFPNTSNHSEGQSIRTTYSVGLYKDSDGPAVRVSYNFSLE